MCAPSKSCSAILHLKCRVIRIGKCPKYLHCLVSNGCVALLDFYFFNEIKAQLYVLFPALRKNGGKKLVNSIH
jgi:hypothetical protein